MKFTTLQEYFYKLRNPLYVFILIPLLVFIYVLMGTSNQPEWVQPDRLIIIISLTLIVGIDWLVATFIFNKMLDKATRQPGLGLKLEQYYVMTIIRYALCSGASLIAVLGYFLTGDSIFSALFGIGLVLFFALWPSSLKICRDLKLKGDEKTMILYKRITLD